MTTSEAIEIAQAVVRDPRIVIQTWADAKTNGTLHEVLSFKAYMALDDVWPRNQTTAESSTAHQLNERMKREVEQPAMRLWRRLQPAGA